MKSWILGACLLLSTALVGAEPMIVTDLKGKAKRGSASLKLLDRLETGSALTVPKESRIILTSLADGTRYSLTGSASAKVAERGLKLLEGQKSQLVIQPGRSVSRGKPKDVSATMGGMLLRDAGFYLETAGALSEPVVRWIPGRDSVGAEVQLEIDGAVVFQQQVEETAQIELPLPPGQPATVTVTLLTSGGVSLMGDQNDPIPGEGSTADIVLLDRGISGELIESARAALEAYRQNPEDTTDLLIAVTHLLEQGLLYDVWSLLNEASSNRELRDLRARVLQAIRSDQTPVKVPAP